MSGKCRPYSIRKAVAAAGDTDASKISGGGLDVMTFATWAQASGVRAAHCGE